MEKPIKIINIARLDESQWDLLTDEIIFELYVVQSCKMDWDLPRPRNKLIRFEKVMTGYNNSTFLMYINSFQKQMALQEILQVQKALQDYGFDIRHFDVGTTNRFLTFEIGIDFELKYRGSTIKNLRDNQLV